MALRQRVAFWRSGVARTLERRRPMIGIMAANATIGAKHDGDGRMLLDDDDEGR